MLFLVFGTLGGLADNSSTVLQKVWADLSQSFLLFFFSFYLVNLTSEFHLKQVSGCIHGMHTLTSTHTQGSAPQTHIHTHTHTHPHAPQICKL